MADLRYTEGADNPDPPLRNKSTSELQGGMSLIWHLGKPLIGEFINSNLSEWVKKAVPISSITASHKSTRSQIISANFSMTMLPLEQLDRDTTAELLRTFVQDNKAWCKQLAAQSIKANTAKFIISKQLEEAESEKKETPGRVRGGKSNIRKSNCKLL
ncbi:hypothetical protein N7533_006270 [Penicillium manginii]|uniref:uncharacterized protein n=1 Tax=Penicillium manginii TaxID=203109 RepID=UPI002547F74D|nr:uncharacterized protein N7533_006270 [Penicillium manginii]KAJ5756727.1 hypothetical protein N7533_006270 [Penicillium manginii]